MVESPGDATQIGRSSSCATASSDGFSTPGLAGGLERVFADQVVQLGARDRLRNSVAIITRYSHSSVL